MKMWLIFSLLLAIVNCSMTAQETSFKDIDLINNESLQIDQSIEYISGNCEKLDRRADMLFLFFSQAESWFFYVFQKKNEQNSEIEWVKVCTEFTGISTKGVFHTLLAPIQFSEILKTYEEIEFTKLPNSISNESFIPDTPQYIIEIRESGEAHRVQLRWQKLSKYQQERDSFLKLWDAFFRFLPLKPPDFKSKRVYEN